MPKFFTRFVVAGNNSKAFCPDYGTSRKEVKTEEMIELKNNVNVEYFGIKNGSLLVEICVS